MDGRKFAGACLQMLSERIACIQQVELHPQPRHTQHGISSMGRNTIPHTSTWSLGAPELPPGTTGTFSPPPHLFIPTLTTHARVLYRRTAVPCVDSVTGKIEITFFFGLLHTGLCTLWSLDTGARTWDTQTPRPTLMYIHLQVFSSRCLGSIIRGILTPTPPKGGRVAPSEPFCSEIPRTEETQKSDISTSPDIECTPPFPFVAPPSNACRAPDPNPPVALPLLPSLSPTSFDSDEPSWPKRLLECFAVGDVVGGYTELIHCLLSVTTHLSKFLESHVSSQNMSSALHVTVFVLHCINYSPQSLIAVAISACTQKEFLRAEPEPGPGVRKRNSFPNLPTPRAETFEPPPHPIPIVHGPHPKSREAANSPAASAAALLHLCGSALALPTSVGRDFSSTSIFWGCRSQLHPCSNCQWSKVARRHSLHSHSLVQ
ncbi:uncharacterized protein CLUP02_01434 [Colletotrichum lupini]|uniref:Uncharacterized protein n=1 Tax=Colletotrichum lupini TaxID=145971 RepID=A0A9Q8W9P8_9PEZI|nr:uncharacterized protein CLUP02_01434 [Colletotrichum lupini]UQC74782.1 hypothetical protein CLUP02_01434 [Colletotrichum lupini]